MTKPVKNAKIAPDRHSIIDCAFRMAMTVPLQELSIVKVAKELGVTPALIHYYLDGRDALTSGVMNAFYRETMDGWPPSTGDWRADMEAVSRQVYKLHVKYAGVASYVVGFNRFRMAQKVTPNERDYGVILFEAFVGAVRAGGFDGESTAVYGHLLMELITSAANATAWRRWPGDHSAFVDSVLAGLDPDAFPNARFVRQSYVRFDSSVAFDKALNLFMTTLEVERAGFLKPTEMADRRRN